MDDFVHIQEGMQARELNKLVLLFWRHCLSAFC
jgi:hypothetical protein